MNLYVFEGVLPDWTDGMAVIIEETLEDAQAIAFENFAIEDTIEEFLKVQSGFAKPEGVYPLVGYHKPGVVHYVYGGS